MIHPSKLNVIMRVLAPRLGAEFIAIDVPPADDIEIENPGGDPDPAPGIAVIPVYGTLVKRATGMDAASGLTSYGDIRSQIDDAMDDPDCSAILLDIDSPGGESAGMFDLSQYIASLRGSKPISAVANDSMYSAAYGLGSAVDRGGLYVTSVGGMGSIGVYMLHVDQSGQDEQRGLKYTYISAGDKKTDFNPHEPLSKAARADAQEEVDRQRDMFVSLVAGNRGVPDKNIYDTEAGCLFADCAVPLLADSVQSLDYTMQQMASRYGRASRSQVSMTGATASNRLLGPGRTHCAAIPPHKTATTDGAWDGPAAEARLKEGQPAGYYRREYAWVDGKKDPTTKGAYKFPHHEVSGGGDIGAANVKACQSGIAALNGARGGAQVGGDRSGVYAHLAKHIRDSGGDPPPLKGEAEETFDPLCARYGAHVLWDMHPNSKAVDAPEPYGDRSLSLRRWDTRAEVSAGARTVSCLVAPYGTLSQDLGGFKEIYAPGCFSRWLAVDDPRALFNHNPDFVVGRKSAGTARFIEKPDGLYFEADAPETNWADDLLESMRRGDINQGSAAFYITVPRWEFRGGQKVRVIEEARLVEASIASFAAYESTTSQVAAEPAAAHDKLLAYRLRLALMA